MKQKAIDIKCLATLEMSGNAGNVWQRWKCLATLEMSGNAGNLWQRWKSLATLEMSGKKQGAPLPACQTAGPCGGWQPVDLDNYGFVRRLRGAQRAWHFFCPRMPFLDSELLQKVPRQSAWRGTFPGPLLNAGNWLRARNRHTSQFKTPGSMASMASMVVAQR
jgi:hypothetical protein